MKRITMLTALAGAAFLFGGCLSRLAKEGFGAATGAKGVYGEVKPIVRPLGMYKNFQVGEIKDAYGGKTPKKLLAELPGEIIARLRAEGIPTGSGRTLIIQGKVIYYEKAGFTGQAFGPFEEVIGEIQLIDKGSGKLIGTANCIGRSNTTSNQGVDKKTEGLAKAIVKWISAHYPKEGRIKQEKK